MGRSTYYKIINTVHYDKNLPTYMFFILWTPYIFDNEPPLFSSELKICVLWRRIANSGKSGVWVSQPSQNPNDDCLSTCHLHSCIDFIKIHPTPTREKQRSNSYSYKYKFYCIATGLKAILPVARPQPTIRWHFLERFDFLREFNSRGRPQNVKAALFRLSQ